MCQFGAAWRKHTRLWTWHVPCSHALEQCKCSMRSGLCSKSGRPHTVLGPSLTRQAQTYHWPFAFAMARLLIHSQDAMQLQAWLSRVDGFTKEG
eukprot:4964971-Alexandrium_andersonii.AAC.1